MHHVPSSRSFRVLWMLAELGMTPEIELYAIPDGSLRTTDFLEKSPAGRVPALEIDGQVIFESGAILEYLAETRPEAALGRAPGQTERVDYLQWMHFAETQASILANLNLQHVFLRDPSTKSPTVLKIEAARLARTLDVIERAVTERDWLLAGGFSAADIMLGFNLYAAPFFVRLDPYPAVRDYIDRIEARPAHAKARLMDGPQAFYSRDFYPWDS
nr:glutathione S-transferase family protein [Mesobacterium pallidum]